MKISAKQYARGLYEAADGQTPAQQTAIIGRFLRLLSAQGKLALADRIVAELDKLMLATNGVVLAEVASARKLSAPLLKQLDELVKTKTGCREVRLTEKLEPALVGGAVVKYQDKIINFSLQNFLNKIKRAFIN